MSDPKWTPERLKRMAEHCESVPIGGNGDVPKPIIFTQAADALRSAAAEIERKDEIIAINERALAEALVEDRKLRAEIERLSRKNELLITTIERLREDKERMAAVLELVVRAPSDTDRWVLLAKDALDAARGGDDK